MFNAIEFLRIKSCGFFPIYAIVNPENLVNPVKNPLIIILSAFAAPSVPLLGE
jgi:hypothetical protein